MTTISKTWKLECDAPKLNGLCGIMHDKIMRPFLISEKSITVQIYLDVLTKYMPPQLEEYQSSVGPVFIDLKTQQKFAS